MSKEEKIMICNIFLFLLKDLVGKSKDGSKFTLLMQAIEMSLLQFCVKLAGKLAQHIKESSNVTFCIILQNGTLWADSIPKEVKW